MSLCETLRAHPEEHNRRTQRAQRNRVNRNEIHPHSHGVAVFDKHAYAKRHDEHGENRSPTRHIQLALQRLDGRLEQIHQARKRSARHRQEEQEAEQAAERHIGKHLGQRDEEQRRT